MTRNVLILVLSLSWAAGARQPASPPDLWIWRTILDARVASDGMQAVYVEERNDRSQDRVYANLALARTDGRERHPFTSGEWRDRSPRWSPDNTRIAWISDRGGHSRVWVAPANGGEPAAISPEGQTAQSLAWSPDGRSIAYLATAETTRLFLVPAAGGEPRRISRLELDFVGEPAWMADGEHIVCAERRGEIFAVRIADGAASQLTRSGEINRDPLPSPDGSKIAYTAASARPQFYAVRRLVVMNADGSRDRILTGNLDRDVRHPQWSNDSRTLYFIADDRGATHVYLARNDGAVRQLTNRAERLHGFSLADNGRAVTVRSSATEGSAVFTFMVDLPAGGWTLVDANEQLLAERNWGAVGELPFESAGKSMQAWLVKPPEFDASHRYPLLVDIADSPLRMYGAEFPLRAQILATEGFVVLLANPRGVPGYGEEFGDLLPTQVPGDPADDILRAVEAAVAKGSVDPKRLVVSGGVLAAWLLGHTDRFQAAVTRNVIVNWATDHDAARWLRDPALFESRSPIRFAENFKTPVLVLAGAGDSQSGELFTAVRKRKVAAEMVQVDDTPSGRVSELEAVLNWLKRGH